MLENLTAWAQVVTAVAAVLAVTVGWYYSSRAHRAAEDRFIRAEERNFELAKLPIVVDALGSVHDAVTALDDELERAILSGHPNLVDGSESEAESRLRALQRRAQSEAMRFNTLAELDWLSPQVKYDSIMLWSALASIHHDLIPAIFGREPTLQPLVDKAGRPAPLPQPDFDSPPPGVQSVTERLKASGALAQLQDEWGSDPQMANALAMSRVKELWEEAVGTALIAAHGTVSLPSPTGLAVDT